MIRDGGAIGRGLELDTGSRLSILMAIREEIIAKLRGLRDQARDFAVRHRIGWRHGAATGAVVLAGLAAMGVARAGSGQGGAPINPSERLTADCQVG